MIIIIINIVLITTYPRDGYRDGYIYFNLKTWMMRKPKFIIFNRFYWFAGQLRSRTS